MNWVLAFLVLTLVNAVITKARTGSVVCINTLLSATWFLAVLLSVLANPTLIAPRDEVYALAFVGLLAFNAIYLLGALPNSGGIGSWNYTHLAYRPRRVILVEVVALLLFLPIALESSVVLRESGFDLSAVRSWYFLESSFESNLANFAFRVLPIAFMTFVNIVAALNVARGNRQFLFLMLVNLAILALFIGDRTSWFAVVAFLFSGGLLTKGVGEGGRTLRRVVLLTALLGIALVSLGRAGDLGNVVRQGSQYVGGGLSFLEFILRQPEQFGLDEPPLLGFLTFGFITEPVVLVGKLLGVTTADIPSYHFNIFAQGFQDIGESQTAMFNNNTTALYVFLRDFGWYGVPVGFAVMAGLLIALERLIRRSGWVGWRVAYAFGCYVTLNTVMFYAALSTVWSVLVLSSLWVGWNASSQVPGEDGVDGINGGRGSRLTDRRYSERVRSRKLARRRPHHGA